MPDRQPLSDQGASAAVAYFAKCAEHGLHGERDDCFVCGEPVAKIGYVRSDLYLKVYSERARYKRLYVQRGKDAVDLEDERDRLRAEVEQLGREADQYRKGWLEKTAEVERLRGSLKTAADKIIEIYQAGYDSERKRLAEAAVTSLDSLLIETARPSDEQEAHGG